MSQTAYAIDPDQAFRGLAEKIESTQSRANGAGAAVGFGIMVRADSVNPVEQFELFGGASEVPLGVLVHNQAQENPALAGALGVDELEEATVLRRGRVWVVVEEAISIGDDVFFRHTAGGGGTEIGAFRTDADTATADQVTQAEWLSETAGAGVALLEINLP